MQSRAMQNRTNPWVVVTLIVAIVAAVSILSAVAMADTAQSQEPGFEVALEESGDATVTLRVTFDLTTDEASVFRELETDATDRTARFQDRLGLVANATANRTGRSMAVTNATSRTYRVNETGVLELSADWANLAATTDDGLRVTEPFASGFQPPREFVVTAPEGYRITDVTPAPAAVGQRQATWAAGTDLTGFTLQVTPASDDTNATVTPTNRTVSETDETTTTGPVPLPTVLLTAGLAAVGAGLWRRRG